VTVVNKQTETLGNYEKQAILELDNRLSLHEVMSIKAKDTHFRLMYSVIHNSYEQKQPVSKCIEKIHIIFEPSLYGSALISATD